MFEPALPILLRLNFPTMLVHSPTVNFLPLIHFHCPDESVRIFYLSSKITVADDVAVGCLATSLNESAIILALWIEWVYLNTLGSRNLKHALEFNDLPLNKKYG